MRAISATLAACLALTAWVVLGALAPTAGAAGSPQQSLDHVLNVGMRAAGNYSGAYVQDLTTGQTLYSRNARTLRLPASVQKLYTTTTALLDFGPNATLTTSVLGAGQQNGDTFNGTLYLRGGGDPTFGSAGFDRANYGAGASMQRLVFNLEAATGIHALNGNVVADESMFDPIRGTPATGEQPSIDVEGELSALTFNRGWANNSGTVYFKHPAIESGQQFVAALKAAGIKLPGKLDLTTGDTPSDANPLTVVHSPRIAKLISLTNTPSDNFFAETLLKDLGARYGAGGTTADGAAVVRSKISQSFGIHLRVNDGSGLSRFDRTTPFDVVTLLRQMAQNASFTGSLAVAGETGTLVHELRGTDAQGRCRGKTGTLHDVSNVVGYCTARDGHTLAYALMMNGIVPTYAHPIQNRMQVAIADYRG
jgi:D-alanyl-D-alanine carboxypeptidase/D-alanyl-D-alanine-endopeptidase (penicillin-binding protein 4)